MSLRDYWYIACESSQLRHQPLAVIVFNDSMVLWRDQTGRPCAALDRCAHRNAPLSAGTVHDGCITCPYHGWRYQGTGECTLVPSLASGRCIPESARIPAFRTMEQDGYIWVCPGDGTPPERPREFPHCQEKGWTTFRMKTRFQSSVEACLENFLDCPHTSTVHRGWFRNPDPQEIDATVRRLPDAVEVSFQNEPVTGSLVSRLLYPKNRPLQHTDRFLMPNLSRVDYKFDDTHHFIITSQATPVTDHLTDVHTVISFRFGRLGWLIRLIFEPMSRHIIKQDVGILALHGPQIAKFGGEAYTHVETDLIGLHMQSLRRRAGRGEPPPEPAPGRTIRIRF
jgi:phenylpropionate dioxygenase-like ring-hydroxylating dioxygenase large terminal subunit